MPSSSLSCTVRSRQPAWTAANRLTIGDPSQALEGADLQRFLEAHEKLTDLLDKMRKVLG